MCRSSGEQVRAEANIRSQSATPVQWHLGGPAGWTGQVSRAHGQAEDVFVGYPLKPELGYIDFKAGHPQGCDDALPPQMPIS
jgi:hypothetical protein